MSDDNIPMDERHRKEWEIFERARPSDNDPHKVAEFVKQENELKRVQQEELDLAHKEQRQLFSDLSELEDPNLVLAEVAEKDVLQMKQYLNKKEERQHEIDDDLDP